MSSISLPLSLPVTWGFCCCQVLNKVHKETSITQSKNKKIIFFSRQCINVTCRNYSQRGNVIVIFTIPPHSPTLSLSLSLFFPSPFTLTKRYTDIFSSATTVYLEWAHTQKEKKPIDLLYKNIESSSLQYYILPYLWCLYQLILKMSPTRKTYRKSYCYHIHTNIHTYICIYVYMYMYVPVLPN